MQICIVALIGLLLSAELTAAQDSKSVQINDEYKGNIEVGTEEYIATALRLTHQKYADDGNFVLNEVYCNSKLKTTSAQLREGNWTVLKGSAKDDNATVVELDDENRKPIHYYLRLKNGDLQQLDSTLYEIKPASKHMLTRQTQTRPKSVRPTHSGMKQ